MTDKNHYFNCLLKRDFIKHVLLRKPKFNDHEISQKLISVLNVEHLQRQMKPRIASLCEEYLTLDKLRESDGRFMKELPEWLNIQYVDQIQDHFHKDLANEFSCDTYIEPIIEQIERLTWLQGVDDMVSNLRSFVADLEQRGKYYASAAIQSHGADSLNLQEKYEAARKITLRERITGSSHEAIIEFRSALLELAKRRCEEAVYTQLSSICLEIAKSKEIHAIIDKFHRIHTEAKKAASIVDECGSHPDWDQEYQRLIPLEFFERNIEDIDASMAFHMAFLYAIARNEASLKAQGYITPNGHLKIFTNPLYDGLRWESTDFTTLFLQR